MTTPPVVRENLTEQEAADRARVIGDVHATVHLDLDRGEVSFASTTDLRFTVADTIETFVDLTALEVHEVVLDGDRLDLAEVVQPTRIDLPRLEPGEHHLRVVATMAYQHEGKGLHRFVDPSDERVYLHSQFQPFDAHLVYACFDQPDLRTTFDLEVDAPAEWVVVSNGAVIEQPTQGDAGRWRFETTPPISPYITAVVAGSYTRVEDVYRRGDGSTIALGLYVRQSLAEFLDADEVFEVTRQGFAAYEQLFEMHYPFGSSYDQLFVPEFSAGAMENPGCVTFSETYVFRSKVTDAIRERRADTILHEMAHMWFGDLVTMRWWDDLWLNESFATFMSGYVQANFTRWRDAWVTFLDAEKAWATYQDQLPSTHPVAGAMPDVESVHQNFDGITYAKGASVLRQLVAWVGDDAFFAGCREYFDRHACSNTELADFLDALERASGRDLAGWRDEWLRTTSPNTLTPVIQYGDDGTYESVVIEQRAPQPSWTGLAGAADASPVLRRHRLAVGVYERRDVGLERVERIELDVTGSSTEVPQLTGRPAGAALLVNDDDLTYAKVRLDPGTMDVLEEELDRLVAPMPRAIVWASTWDMVRDAELPAGRFVDLVLGNVIREDQIGVLQRLQQRAVAATERYGAAEHRPARLEALARASRTAMEAANPSSDHQLAWTRHWAGVARGDREQIADVRRLLDGEFQLDGLAVDADLRWHLVISLAHAGAADDELIAAELSRDDTDLGRRHAATARAIRPLAEAKEAAWHQLLDDPSLSHTMSRQVWTGFLQLDQADLLEPFVDRYIDALDRVWSERSLDWAIEFTAAMFPHAAASDALRERIDAFLERDDVARPLRRVLLEERDTLLRALDAQNLDARSS